MKFSAIASCVVAGCMAVAKAAFAPGDLFVVGYHGDFPEQMRILVTRDLLEGEQFTMSDAAYSFPNATFVSNEGFYTYTVPPRGVSKGTVLPVNLETNDLLPDWTFSGGAGLKAGGDSMILFSGTDYIHAVGYKLTTWTANDAIPSGTSDSGLPPGLTTDNSPMLSHENAIYIGTKTGTPEVLLEEIGKVSNWQGSSDIDATVDLTTVETGWTIESSGGPNPTSPPNPTATPTQSPTPETTESGIPTASPTYSPTDSPTPFNRENLEDANKKDEDEGGMEATTVIALGAIGFLVFTVSATMFIRYQKKKTLQGTFATLMPSSSSAEGAGLGGSSKLSASVDHEP